MFHLHNTGVTLPLFARRSGKAPLACLQAAWLPVGRSARDIEVFTARDVIRVLR